MNKKCWILSLCFVAMFGLAGCDDDDDPPRIPDPGDTTIDDPMAFEAQFNQLMQQVIIPVIETLSTFNPFNPVIQAQQMAGGSELGLPCDDITEDVGCLTGSAERCPTGPDEVEITFSSCEVQAGYTVSGSIVASETDNFAEADWNVTVVTVELGPVQLVGHVDLTESSTSIVVDMDMQANFDVGSATLVGRLSSNDAGGGCVRQDTDNVELFSPGLIVILDGALTFCPPDPWPDGTREMIIVDSTSDFRYEMNYDSADLEINTSVYDNSSNQLLAVCVTDLSIDPPPSTCDVFD